MLRGHAGVEEELVVAMVMCGRDVIGFRKTCRSSGMGGYIRLEEKKAQ
jgi:hypothetical protein